MVNTNVTQAANNEKTREAAIIGQQSLVGSTKRGGSEFGRGSEPRNGSPLYFSGKPPFARQQHTIIPKCTLTIPKSTLTAEFFTPFSDLVRLPSPPKFEFESGNLYRGR
jgi:hypothetical protein